MTPIKTSNTEIGLFFGSFNPVHIGHLIIANQILATTPLQEVWMVVSPQSPAKTKSSLVSADVRIKMIELATKHHPNILPTDVELSLPTPSYTIHTLEHLRVTFPKKQFHLILGSDNLYGFRKWKRYEDILNEFKIFVYPRLGYFNYEFKSHSSVQKVDAPILQLSATQIRNKIRSGESISFFVPKEVEDFILKNKIYK